MKKNIGTWMLLAALMLTLCACGSEPGAESSSPAAAEGQSEDDGQIIVSETVEESGREDGERFESTILLEGMEETVAYEHVKNQAIGFELDYEYEDLERRGDGERECFVSRWDAQEEPQNYLEIRHDTGNAELVADALKASLSGAYDSVNDETYALERAGYCVRIQAAGAKEGTKPAGSLQTVYVIPFGESCLVAVIHCTYESAEGFGARFEAMMNTLTLLDLQG